MPDRNNKPDIHRSEQGVLNRSFDETYQVLAVENLEFDGANLVRATSDRMATRIDDQSPIIYIGKAPVGSSESSAVWQIAKLDTSSGLIKTWAGTGFDQVWADRSSLTYQ